MARSTPRSRATAKATTVTKSSTTPDEQRPSSIGSVTGLLLRFISCGLLSLAAGAVWRLTLAPSRIGIGSALLGIMILLSGFVVGGALWYVRDARVRMHHPERVADERIVFSFVVFGLVPLAVLVLVALVWGLALLVGA